jgi:cold-inducible RNA-binding protein
VLILLVRYSLFFAKSTKQGRSEKVLRRKEYQKTMSQNLFIGSLAYATTDDSLKAFFETIGEVTSARVVTDRDSGRSKGFGFVEFADEANNQKAVDDLNGKELDGRAINVNLARPKEDRPRRDFNGGGSSDRGGNGGGNGGGSFRQRSW